MLLVWLFLLINLFLEVHPPPQPSGGIPTEPNQQARGITIARSDDREFDRMSWVQQQRKHPNTVVGPNAIQFQYDGPMDHTVAHPNSDGGCPILVAPPNNVSECTPSPIKFCVPPLPPAYKRPYPCELTPDQIIWDPHHTIFEQQQQQGAAVAGARSTSARGSQNKKRKSTSGTAATTNRSTATRPPQLSVMSSFSGSQRISQITPPPGNIKSGGFGSVSIGFSRFPGMGGSHQANAGDPINGIYVVC